MDFQIHLLDPKTVLISGSNTQQALMWSKRSKETRNEILLLSDVNQSRQIIPETELNRHRKFIIHSMQQLSETIAGTNLHNLTKIPTWQTKQWIHLISKDQGSNQDVAVVNCCRCSKSYFLKIQLLMFQPQIGRLLTVKKVISYLGNVRLRCDKLLH